MRIKCWPFKAAPAAVAAPAAAVAHAVHKVAHKVTVWRTVVCVTIASPFVALPPLVWHQTPPYPVSPYHSAHGPTTMWEPEDSHYHHNHPHRIPEPATIVLLGGAVLLVTGMRKKA